MLSRATVVEICAASARTDTERGGRSLKEDEMRTASRLEFDAGPLAMGANVNRQIDAHGHGRF